jgi:RNA exonuclease 1
VVCLVVEGVGVEDYLQHRDAGLSWLPANLPPLLEVVSPASYSYSMQEELALMPLTVKHKRRLIDEFGSLENSLEKGEAFKAFRSIFPVTVPEKREVDTIDSKSDSLKLRLLLSASQMVTENYPLPLTGAMADRYKHYKLTNSAYKEVSASSPVFSVDCEMCLTDSGSELTRICVVDSSLGVVYHTLVLRRNPIRNYLTKYSGITADMLEGVTIRLEDVQEKIQKLLPADAILVGQSLNCDLAAMQMLHPYVIDTSVCFNITWDRRRKSKLSLLAHLFLNMRIQTQGKHGHSPIEDAQTAMKLVNLKLEKGLAFGDVVMGGQIPVMDDGGCTPCRSKRRTGKRRAGIGSTRT